MTFDPTIPPSDNESWLENHSQSNKRHLRLLIFLLVALGVILVIWVTVGSTFVQSAKPVTTKASIKGFSWKLSFTIERYAQTGAIQQWVYDRVESTAGVDRSPFWPTVKLFSEGIPVIGAERISKRDRLYTVVFVDNSDPDHPGEYIYYTNNENEWMQYDPSKTYDLPKNKFGR